MKKYLVAFALTTTLSSGAYACAKPVAKPEFPDAETAVSAQMVKANNDVKAYVKEMQEYLGCARLSKSAEKNELDELKAYAESFNQVIRAYKAKNGG